MRMFRLGAAAVLALAALAACGDSTQAFCDQREVFDAAVQNVQTFAFEKGSVDLDELEKFGDDAPDEVSDDTDLAVDYLVELHEAYWLDGATDDEIRDAVEDVQDDVDLREFGEAVQTVDVFLLESCS